MHAKENNLKAQHSSHPINQQLTTAPHSPHRAATATAAGGRRRIDYVFLDPFEQRLVDGFRLLILGTVAGLVVAWCGVECVVL